MNEFQAIRPGNVFLSTNCLSVSFADRVQSPEPIEIVRPSDAPTGVPLAATYVRIRPIKLEDTQIFFSAAQESLGQLSRWMTWATPDYSQDECQRFVKNAVEAWKLRDHFTFAVIDARDNSFLGSIGLNHLNRAHNLANVGYWVRSSRTRSGIGSAAAVAAAHFGFGVLGLGRLEFLVPTANIASQRVAQRAGAKFEGILRNRLVLSGRAHDAAVYSLVPGDLVSPGT